MAVYKVPQDVEADDKLIGPFSFRQFIYLVIVSLAIALAWGLGHISIPLAIIPLPIVVFFGALALPLRKDQPMEIFMAAMVSFYLKPRKRLWDPDGIDSLIEITAPKTIEPQRTKDISQNEAERRFGYLAEIVDSRGWAVRGVGVQAPNSAMNSDVYFEAQQIQDVLDNDSTTTRTLNYKLDQSDAHRHQEMVDIMNGKVNTPQSTPGSFNYFGSSMTGGVAPDPIYSQDLEYNPYPDDIQQAVLQPLDEPSAPQHHITSPAKPVVKTPPTTSEKVVSADIINLASNTDLSIEAIAREANRIQEKQDLKEEVVVSLR
jgi:hypothetical protein